jgi:hypothetical protein
VNECLFWRPEKFENSSGNMRLPGIWEYDSTSFLVAKKQLFSGENFWFCAAKECVFWGKFLFCAMIDFLGKILV